MTKRPYWLVKNPKNRATPDMYIIEPTSIHTVIPNIINQSVHTSIFFEKLNIVKSHPFFIGIIVLYLSYQQFLNYLNVSFLIKWMITLLWIIYFKINIVNFVNIT